MVLEEAREEGVVLEQVRVALGVLVEGLEQVVVAPPDALPLRNGLREDLGGPGGPVAFSFCFTCLSSFFWFS